MVISLRNIADAIDLRPLITLNWKVLPHLKIDLAPCMRVKASKDCGCSAFDSGADSFLHVFA